MRIDLNTNTAVSGAQTEKAHSSSQSTHSAATQAGNSRISDSKADVGSLAAAAMSAPEVRSQKIAALQSQLQAGTYRVSSTAVASSMLEQMRVRVA